MARSARRPCRLQQAWKIVGIQLQRPSSGDVPWTNPERVNIGKPLMDDEKTLEKELLGRRVSREGFTMEERWALDANMKQVALAKDYDCIVLMVAKAFAEFKVSGKLPRSLKLNILSVQQNARKGESLRARE
jgi:hypothetical protein